MIDHYLTTSPNCWKVSIFLEEAGLPFENILVDLGKEEQKGASFLKINPNGKVPAIIDHEAEGLVVWESGAILYYLANKTGLFLSADPVLRVQTIQWLMFQMSGVGPMMGQANIFNRLFPERIEVAINRYQNEVRRLQRVMDDHLKGRTYFVDAYSIADIAIWPWVYMTRYIGLDLAPYPNLTRWMETIGERPAVQRGIRHPVDLTSIFEGSETEIVKFTSASWKSSIVERGERPKFT